MSFGNVVQLCLRFLALGSVSLAEQVANTCFQYLQYVMSTMSCQMQLPRICAMGSFAFA